MLEGTKSKEKIMILGSIRGVTIKACIFEDADGNPAISVYGETYAMIDGLVNYTVGDGGINMFVPAHNLEKQKALMNQGKHKEALDYDFCQPSFLLTFN